MIAIPVKTNTAEIITETSGMGTDLSLLRRVADLYIEGFRSMKVGRQLWLLIALKLLILFGVMKVFFFPNVLKSQFETDAARSAYVLEHLTKE